MYTANRKLCAIAHIETQVRVGACVDTASENPRAHPFGYRNDSRCAIGKCVIAVFLNSFASVKHVFCMV